MRVQVNVSDSSLLVNLDLSVCRWVYVFLSMGVCVFVYALRVHPAETRLTVYRRLRVLNNLLLKNDCSEVLCVYF